MAIYGIIMAVIFQTKIGETGENVTLKDYYSGFSIFWAGMAVGVTNIICGYVMKPTLSRCFFTWDNFTANYFSLFFSICVRKYLFGYVNR